MIRSFGDAATRDLYHGQGSARRRRFPADVVRSGQRKLDMIHAAHRLDDLAAPPGNRLERLKGRMKDWWSVRINDRWRVVFRWKQDGAYHVTVADYHQ